MPTDVDAPHACAESTSAAGLVTAAAALRWSRPDLTAAVAEHVAEAWRADPRTWLVATGWLLHGRSAVGDGRTCAVAAMAAVGRRPELLDDPAADRLRIELAALAVGAGEPAVARLLVDPVLARGGAEVRADALTVLAHCVLEERPSAVDDAVERVDRAWREVAEPAHGVAEGGLALLSAAALRRTGQLDAAAARAADGVTRLGELDHDAPDGPSRHLAAALLAEWVLALVDDGRSAEARARCVPMARALCAGRATRQTALLRLAVARALDEHLDGATVEVADALEQAAADAAACDAPDLESRCLFTLSALRERSGQWAAAVDSMRRGTAAQRQHRARSEQFHAALRALVPAEHSTAPSLPGPFVTADRVDERSPERLREATPGLDRPSDAVPGPAISHLPDIVPAAIVPAAIVPAATDPVPDLAPDPPDQPVVVLDVTADGARRPGCADLLRRLDARLSAVLPAEARTRVEPDGSALSVTRSGWTRSDAAEWMYRVLPEVFAATEDVTPDGEPAALRAVVHEGGGPVGARLLHRIAAPPRPGPVARERHAAPATAPAAEPGDRPAADRPAGTPTTAAGRHRRPAADEARAPRNGERRAGGHPAEAVDPPRRRVGGAPRHHATSDRDQLGSGSPGGAAVSPVADEAAPISDRNGSPLHGSAVPRDPADPDSPPPAAAEEFSVEGWGLADLLAGALAAYRGI